MQAAKPASPLATVTVLEIGTHLAGPLAATHLLDLGARVIAVRPPKHIRERHGVRDAVTRALEAGKEVVTLEVTPVVRTPAPRYVHGASLVYGSPPLYTSELHATHILFTSSPAKSYAACT